MGPAATTSTSSSRDPDLVGIATPIRDETGCVVAAVSVAALASRVTPEREPEIVRLVQDAVRASGARLAVVAGGPLGPFRR